MKNTKLEKEILDIVHNNPAKSYGRIFTAKKYQYLREELKRNTTFVVEDSYYKITICLYCYINNLTDYPKCQNPNCKFGNQYLTNKNFENYTIGFSKFCSSWCRHNNPITQVLQQQTKLKKYNDPFFNNTAQARKTRFEKYRQYSPLDFGQKTRDAYNAKSDEEKMQIQLKCEKRNLELRNEKTALERKFRRNLDKTYKSYYDIICKDQFDEPCFSYEEYVNRTSDKQLLKFKCKKCGTVFYAKHDNGCHKHCPKCFPRKTAISQLNRRIYAILTAAKIPYTAEYKIDDNDKSRYYDIKFDVTNVILELNGDYWHANPEIYNANNHIVLQDTGKMLVKDIWDYDQYKKNLAKKNGYDVIYLWEKQMKQMSDNDILVWINEQIQSK